MTDNPFKIQIEKSIYLSLISSLIGIIIFVIIVFIFSNIIGAIITMVMVVFFSAIGIFFKYLYLHAISYSVDTKNFTFKGGVISRFEKILPYSKIQHVILYESLWQRIFGLTSISIETAREGMMGGAQTGGYNADNSLAGMKNPLIPDLKKEEAQQLKNYIIKASNLKSRVVAGI